MKVTLEEMVETFWATAFQEPYPPEGGGAVTAAMISVIEKHIGPMIEDAARFGFRLDEGQEISEVAEGIRLYRARIISSLTDPEPQDKP